MGACVYVCAWVCASPSCVCVQAFCCVGMHTLSVCVSVRCVCVCVCGSACLCVCMCVFADRLLVLDFAFFAREGGPVRRFCKTAAPADARPKAFLTGSGECGCCTGSAERPCCSEPALLLRACLAVDGLRHCPKGRLPADPGVRKKHPASGPPVGAGCFCGMGWSVVRTLY